MSFEDGELAQIIRDAEDGDSHGAKRILSEQPVLEIENAFYWTAFEELSTERAQGMSGAGQIPLSAMWRYCRYLDMTRDETDAFTRVMMTVDNRRAVLMGDKARKQTKGQK